MGSTQAALSFLTNVARAAFGIGTSAAALMPPSTPSTEDNGPSSSIGLGGSPSARGPISSSLGSRSRSYSTPEVSRLRTFFDTLLLTERPQVSALIRESLIRRAREFNIILDDVAVTHLSYGVEFSRAIEQKQVAQQEAERSKFIVMKADQERRAAIIRAEGESESAKLISDATAAAGMGLIELRRIEASREMATTLSRNQNVAYLPDGQQALLSINPSGFGGR
ncbi:hypothetical protein MLD38_022713 [Melastoma candidum]|uniref:Uncharacterized protein n=1 Tax=Melastoma candidum TaxID=119954 RepID=A0ACB9QK50_9MYRT|nr:hypothetical protein MLD38_022713 [Melastoma candidum]